MDKRLEIALILLIAAFVVAVILLSGCASPEKSPPNFGAQPGIGEVGQTDEASLQTRTGQAPESGNRAMGPEGFGNLTEEERRQMQQEREQLSISACEGKNEGASCEFSFAQGAQKMGGICTSRNSTLSCLPERGMGRGFGQEGSKA